MAGSRRRKSLFEEVPALGAISASGAGSARLVAVTIDHPGFTLVEGSNIFGRDPAQCNQLLNTNKVSRRHCEIIVHGTTFRVRDLESHNGCYVNGQPVQDMEVVLGDEVSLSREVTFRLVMDEELEKPDLMEMADLSRDTRIARPVEELAAPEELTPGPSYSARVSAVVVEPDLANAYEEMRRQRDLLAILYQISLRCMEASNKEVVEELLVNVYRRLISVDLGFILYNCSGKWRANICPGRTQPSQKMVRAFYRFAVNRREPCIVTSREELATLGFQSGSAIVVPLMKDDQPCGVLGGASKRGDAFSRELLHVAKQLATVAAVALA